AAIAAVRRAPIWFPAMMAVTVTIPTAAGGMKFFQTSSNFCLEVGSPFSSPTETSRRSRTSRAEFQLALPVSTAVVTAPATPRPVRIPGELSTTNFSAAFRIILVFIGAFFLEGVDDLSEIPSDLLENLVRVGECSHCVSDRDAGCDDSDQPNDRFEYGHRFSVTILLKPIAENLNVSPSGWTVKSLVASWDSTISFSPSVFSEVMMVFGDSADLNVPCQ